MRESDGLGLPQPLLVERDAEVAALDSVLVSARAGRGSVLLLEGPPGIGKTSLLALARRHGSEGGMRVLRGRGTELEREYPLGVVRQCLGPALRRESNRERLLHGAARLAGPAVLDVTEEIVTPPAGLLHGLYWLVANLADESPLLMLVDDAQRADELSLRFLAYLASRTEELALAIVITARDAESAATGSLSGLEEIRRDPSVLTVRPRVLTPAGVADMLSGTGAGTVDDVFAGACRDATGGNPFLLGELVLTLVEEGVPFIAAAVDRVTEVTPPTVARTAAATLARLGAAATALARAAATLGDGAGLDLAAQVGGVPAADAASLAAELAHCGLLDDSATLSFRHPLLASAVRAGLTTHERSAAHARAVEVLRARGAAPDRLAPHLLETLPGGDDATVSTLRVAAEIARTRGAMATAVALLERALAEPPEAALRAEVLLELGRAEFAASGADSAAESHLAEAERCAVDPLTRGRVLPLLAQMSVPGSAASRRILDRAREILPEVERRDRDVALRVRALLVLSGLPEPVPSAPDPTLAEAVFLAHAVFGRHASGATAAEIADLAERAALRVDGLTGEGGEGGMSLVFSGVALGLRWTDRLDAAETFLERALRGARERGSAADFAAVMAHRASVRRRSGRLRDAEADARAALDVALAPGITPFVPAVAPLVGALLDRGHVEDAARELDRVPPVEALPHLPPTMSVLLARMALRAARRDVTGALADWDAALARSTRTGGLKAPWIDDLCVVAATQRAAGDLEAAADTVATALELARAWDTPGAIGQALGAQAQLAAPQDAVELLRDAVELLGRSPARLERARALVALGGALRRQGHRVDSRGPLREGFALAAACGAETLAELARTELRASGIRLRREAAAGADALTPSERRIADMAAAGLSNPEIAQELFLTVKTVEMHLTQTYRKLDITRRTELVDALTTKT